ncbi:ABC transporter permease [Botrimarina sp.]|uniref:ABC transporter permease n=1 Tax=Botrimarina sp. TaxID=2795802 RepID=UPI0032EE74FA
MPTTTLPQPNAETSPQAAPGQSPGTSDAPAAVVAETIIEPRKSWRLFDPKELNAYRDLFRFLVWRKIRVRYAQSAIGVGWAVIQPVFSAIVFTIVFGRMAGIDTGGVPYPLFVFAALVPWTYFANATTDGISSLVGEASMIRKVYFPRLFLPMSAVSAKLVDFLIAMLCLAALMVVYGRPPSWSVVLLPLLIALLVAAATAISLWLAALAVQFRDVNYAAPFFIQLGMYASPVVYSTAISVPDRYRLLYAINPIAGVIEGFRATLLGTGPMPWDMIAVGAATTTVALLSGLVFFRSKEKIFADVA